MRPRSFDRGNGCGICCFGPIFRSFNEAAVVRPRKQCRLVCAVSATNASMRPRSFDRGNKDNGDPFRSDVQGFNEAAVVRPRKRAG